MPGLPAAAPKRKQTQCLQTKNKILIQNFFCSSCNSGKSTRFAKQAENVIALNAQLRQNKFFHKLGARLGNNYMRLVELGNLPLVDNQHLVGKRQRFFRVMRNNDGS